MQLGRQSLPDDPAVLLRGKHEVIANAAVRTRGLG